MIKGFNLTPDAKASLIAIALYTEQQWGKKQRNTYLKMLDDSFHQLVISSNLGKPRPEIHQTLQSFAVGKHVVFYLVQDNILMIVNILHERMEPNKHI